MGSLSADGFPLMGFREPVTRFRDVRSFGEYCWQAAQKAGHKRGGAAIMMLQQTPVYVPPTYKQTNEKHSNHRCL